MSVRLVWPFLRAAGATRATLSILARHGILARHLARPEGRVRCSAAFGALRTYVAWSGDGGIGARAGAALEAGDLGLVEYAAASCENLRAAVACAARHFALVVDDAEIGHVEEGDATLYVLCAEPGAARHPAAGAFAAIAAAVAIRRLAGLDGPIREVHLQAIGPGIDGDALAAVAGKVRYGMPHDGVVVDRADLDAPMPRACVDLREAFESYASELGDRDGAGFRRRIREVAAAELRSGRLSMDSAASALGISASTLRRRLQEEQTTFRAVVDEIRCDLAERYLLDRHRRIGEIACLLGFSTVAAFNKAFRRWKGVNPSEHRSNVA